MPITNFFAHLAAIPFKGCLNMTLHRDGELLTVSLLLQNNSTTDSAKATIPPLILKGSAKDLCEGFFDAIAEPIAKTSALLVNLEQYHKAQETAKKTATVPKKASNDAPAQKHTPEQIKQMKYAGAMDDVDALEAEGKFKEAWMKVPQPSEFPDKAQEICPLFERINGLFFVKKILI